jgi:hypothetical protein
MTSCYRDSYLAIYSYSYAVVDFAFVVDENH